MSTILPPQKWCRLTKEYDYHYQTGLETTERWNDQALAIAFESYVWWWNRTNTIINRRNWLINFWNPKNKLEAEAEIHQTEIELDVNLQYLQVRADELEEEVRKSTIAHYEELNLPEQVTYGTPEFVDHHTIKGNYFNRIINV